MSEENRVDDIESQERSYGCDESIEGRKAGKSPWNVEVDVYLKTDCPDPQFDIVTTLPRDPEGRIIFANKHRPGFTITFKLFDDTGMGYLFPPQRYVQDACWSQVGNSCPREPIWDVFDPRTVGPDRTTLVVYNDNPSPAIGDFKYALRVTRDDGDTYCDIDPGGSDSNGPRA